MSHGRKLALLAAATLAVAATVAAGRHGQGPKQTPPPALQKAAEDFYTITDVDKQEPSAPEARSLRRLRGNRFNLKNKNADPGRFVITEETQSGFGMFPTHSEPEPALPAAQSDVIVVGEVRGAGAFLSTDKTSIYSEFTVSVSEVLKATPHDSITPGVSISVTRGGGAVRFPSGKVVRRGFDGKPLPRMNRTYLFFLKSTDASEDFSIITAYELRGGRVHPLDGLDLSGHTVRELAAHQKFEAVDEVSFLATVHQAIVESAGGTQPEVKR